MKASSPWAVKPCVLMDPDSPHLQKWELIVDPDDSMVIGGCFTLADISEGHNKVVFDCWVIGTQFRHTRTGKIIEVYAHKIYTIHRTTITKCILKYKTVKVTDQLELSL